MLLHCAVLYHHVSDSSVLLCQPGIGIVSHLLLLLNCASTPSTALDVSVISDKVLIEVIWDALCRRFGEVDEAREAMRKFEQRRKLDTESVVEFEQALRSLYRVAWPKATPEQKEAALKTRFEEGLSNHDMHQYLRLHALGDTFANTVQKARRFAATTEVPRSRKSVRITTPPAHKAVQMLKEDSSLHQRLDKLEDMIQSPQATSGAESPPSESSAITCVNRKPQQQFPTSRSNGNVRGSDQKSPQNRRRFIRPFNDNVYEPRQTQTETNRSVGGSGIPSGRDSANQTLVRAGSSGLGNVQRPPGVPPGVCWVCRQPRCHSRFHEADRQPSPQPRARTQTSAERVVSRSVGHGTIAHLAQRLRSH